MSSAARLKAGLLLRRLQHGDRLDLPHSRPMPSIGLRCHERRIPEESVTWRIVYRVYSDVILILDVFSKKTQKTPASVVQACRRRLQAYDALARH